MPLYTFECKKCKHIFEQMQKLSDVDDGNLPLCPECSSNDTERKITGLRSASSTWSLWRR